MREIAERPVAAEQAVHIGLAHHHAAEQEVFRDRRADAREVGAELPAVECLGDDRPPLDRGAGQVVAVVGMPPAGEETELGPCDEIVDRPGPVLQIDRAARIRPAIADQRVEIGGRILRAVDEPRLPVLAVAGYPERAGRCCPGAAHLKRLLADQHVEPFERGDQRRGHPARPGAGDQEIDLAVPVILPPGHQSIRGTISSAKTCI